MRALHQCRLGVKPGRMSLRLSSNKKESYLSKVRQTMSSCAIRWCGKNSMTSNVKTDGITFHRFPKEPDVKDVWITATKREKWFPSAYSVICSRHFAADCFVQMKGRRRLYASAVPTLLLPQLSNQDETCNHEEPSTSSILQKALETSDIINTSTKITKNNLPTNCKVSATEKVLSRKVSELSIRLKNANRALKNQRGMTGYLTKKVNTFKSLIEKLKSKGLITQENIDIERLQTSNKQLRKKVVLLRRLLNEQKKRNICAKRSVVWCPAADGKLDQESDQEA